MFGVTDVSSPRVLEELGINSNVGLQHIEKLDHCVGSSQHRREFLLLHLFGLLPPSSHYDLYSSNFSCVSFSVTIDLAFCLSIASFIYGTSERPTYFSQCSSQRYMSIPLLSYVLRFPSSLCESIVFHLRNFDVLNRHFQLLKLLYQHIGGHSLQRISLC